ncbi:MAG TPA: hypothetical protein VEL28_06225 [Candidatus Binatia bacterium]|nr:hypothetical protein [Candidatus Binatia bacterium]
MPEKLTDGEMAAKLITRLKLVVAVSEDMPIESKLEIQPMLREVEGHLSLPIESQDTVRVRAYYDAMLEVSDSDPNVEALLKALRNFVPYL